MHELISAFGIDWRLLVINSINFGLLLFVLWYFLYQPLITMLETRRAKIASGMASAEEAERQLKEIEESRAHKLALAGKEADTLVAHARATAQKKQEEILAQSEQAAARITETAEAQAREAKAQALLESKQEVAKLIVLGVEKMMHSK